MSWELQFSRVGRGKLSWKLILEQLPTEAVVARLAEKALASRDVDAFFHENDPGAGTIIVGGFRPVGTFTIKQIEAA